MDNEQRREIIAKSPITFEGLRKLNIGAVHCTSSRDLSWSPLVSG